MDFIKIGAKFGFVYFVCMYSITNQHVMPLRTIKTHVQTIGAMGREKVLDCRDSTTVYSSMG